MRKLLKAFFIIQEKGVLDEFKRTRTLRRINPYNPFSYITLVLILLIAIILFGFVGVWKEIDLANPFKWK